jgi:hypothetical protein
VSLRTVPRSRSISRPVKQSGVEKVAGSTAMYGARWDAEPRALSTIKCSITISLHAAREGVSWGQKVLESQREEPQSEVQVWVTKRQCMVQHRHDAIIRDAFREVIESRGRTSRRPYGCPA